MIKKIFINSVSIKKLSFCCFILWFLTINSATAITYRVGSGGSAAGCTHNNIQAAINAGQNQNENINILVTNQHEWFETLSINSPQAMLIQGGYDNCTTTNPSDNNSVINAINHPNIPGIEIIDSDFNLGKFQIKNATSSGITAISSVVEITAVLLSHNVSRFGGGLYVRDNSEVRLSQSLVNRNKARNGGGIACSSGSTVTIEASQVDSNHTYQNEVEGGFGRGGGIHAENCTLIIQGHPSLGKSLILFNSAISGGGGIYAGDGMNGGSAITISDTIIATNYINHTGAIPVLGGGGIALSGNDTSLEASNLILARNYSIPFSTVISGGAIYLTEGASFNMKVDKPGNNCGTNPYTDSTMCSQIAWNITSDSSMIFVDELSTASINQTFIANNKVNTTHFKVQLGKIIGTLALQNNVIKVNGGGNQTTAGVLFQIEGSFFSDFNTFIDNFVPKLVLGIAADNLHITRSILIKRPNTLTYSDFLPGSPSNTLFNCLLLNAEDNSLDNGANILVIPTGGSPFQTNWPYHIKQDSRAYDMCDRAIPGIALPLSGDMDNDGSRPPCSGLCSAKHDAGADEYSDFSDLIFENGFG